MNNLRVKSLPFFNFLQREENEEALGNDIQRQRLLRQFETALKRMLQTGQEALKKLELCDPYPLGHLCHPPLWNLSKLSIKNTEDISPVWIWDAITFINFERDMPNLEQVKICIQTQRGRQVFGEDLWPGFNVDVVPHCCISARKLELEFQFQGMNMGPFHTLFPNISHLCVTVGSRTDEQDFALLGQICKYWPGLDNLDFSVMNDRLARILDPTRPNYDAEFLGVHEDEVMLLRGQDEGYLRNVHIVPVRPSLLAMPSKF